MHPQQSAAPAQRLERWGCTLDTAASYPPILSRPAWEEMEGDVRINDTLRKAVVFIGEGGDGLFTPHGTGFVAVSFIGEKAFQNIVTARHVIRDIGSEYVHVRVNTHQGEARVLPTLREHWHPHPDKRVDVSICPSLIPKDQFDIMHLPLEAPLILTEEVIKKEKIGIGDEIFAAGMFVSRIGERKNIPIVRVGVISAMPEEKIETTYGYHHAYLIETHSIDGLSGSPVFIHLPPFRVVEQSVEMSEYSHFLMGMLLGHNQVTNPKDIIEIEQRDLERPNDEPRTVRASVPLNTGIGVVIPISYIVEAVEQPDVRRRREEALMKEKQERRFVPDSAAGTKQTPTTDENPQHKEDFNSLLGAAARGKQSDDQT